jgi:cell wall-associated NlpC family hydrolase
MTLPIRKRLIGLLPVLFCLAAVVSPFASPMAVAADGQDAMATEQVYVRTGPSTADAILGELFNGDWVTLTGYSENGFHEIWYGDYVAYVYADYLSVGGAVEESAAAAAAGPAGTAYTNDAVNLRADATTDSGVIAVLPAGAEVYLTGNVANGFSEVDSGYGWGWIATEYLGGSAPVSSEAAVPEAPSAGQQLVDYAMQFHGYAYVWAGNTPSGGFDCSGLTQYVVQNVLGYDITHSTDIQATHGTPVAWGEWQPGDLIFFVGTGGSGYISHVGIYIGDGQMIHAENASTGVVVSSVYSDYYSSHYYSSTRLV